MPQMTRKLVDNFPSFVSQKEKSQIKKLFNISKNEKKGKIRKKSLGKLSHLVSSKKKKENRINQRKVWENLEIKLKTNCEWRKSFSLDIVSMRKEKNENVGKMEGKTFRIVFHFPLYIFLVQFSFWKVDPFSVHIFQCFSSLFVNFWIIFLVVFIIGFSFCVFPEFVCRWCWGKLQFSNCWLEMINYLKWQKV